VVTAEAKTTAEAAAKLAAVLPSSGK
jgi:hypothetical protein